MEAKPRILLVEPDPSALSTVRPFLERSGYRVDVAATADAALHKIATSRPDALLAGMTCSDGGKLFPKVRELDPSLAVGLLSPTDRVREGHPGTAGADACLTPPFSSASLDGCVRSLLRIGALRRRLALLESRPAPEPIPVVEGDAPAAGLRGASAGGFDFFRRLLQVEVQRSRRYKYPLAFLLAAVDRWEALGGDLAPSEQASLMGKVLRAVVDRVRDVDLCALYGPERFVVFMPHTSPEGARLVAGRILGRVGAISGVPAGLTLSIGLACYDGRGPASYGALLREANASLRKAAAAGGNRIESAWRPKSRNRVVLA